MTDGLDPVQQAREQLSASDAHDQRLYDAERRREMAERIVAALRSATRRAPLTMLAAAALFGAVVLRRR